jgi:hypothetical protein
VQTNNKKYTRKAEITLEVNGELWHPVSRLHDSASDDKHYVVRINEDGMAVILFGDGKHGARPPTGGNNVKITLSPNRHFKGVLLQPGRVQLDDDWNENDVRSGRFCGIYRGLIVDNTDPQSLMRLLVQVPAVLGTKEVWALPCIPVGTSVVPAIGEGVWIEFESGDPSYPVWMGTWTGTK